MFAPGAGFYGGLYGKPWLDEYLARFAERLIVEEELGADGWTDLLALSFSALDYAGHNFGPDSPEVLDTLLMAYKVAEDSRVRVPTAVGYDGYVISYTAEPVEIPDQALVDEWLPPNVAMPDIMPDYY